MIKRKEMTIANFKLTCSNCGHHMYDHGYADPKNLTKKERREGAVPWYCAVEDCGCIEFLPGRVGGG